MDTPLGIVLLVLVLSGLGATIGYGMNARARGMLDRWAHEEGYTLQDVKFRLFMRGPFWFSGRGHVVFWVAARDADGHERRGWARCGSWLTGVMANKVEVRWDGEDT